MKRLKRLAHRISAQRARNNERGSIVVEAALVMPIIIIVLLLFVSLIRLNTIQMALHATASQAVRQIAAHIYPVEIAWQGMSSSNVQPGTSTEPSEATTDVENKIELPPWNEIAAKAAEWLPAPGDLLVSSALRGDWRPLQNMAATELGRGAIEPLLQELADEYALDADNIRLHMLMLPDLSKKNEPYITIALEYEFPFKLPFYGRPIVLLEQASERVWISDALAAQYGSDMDQSDNIPLQIVSIEPSPLKPGRKATVVALTAPGTVLSLEVVYKSGSSKAKNLGEARADSNGRVEWTWHVSGNTTPGVWLLTASTADDPSHAVSMHFIVEK